MNHTSKGPFILSEAAKQEMLNIGKWAKYIAVSGFVIGGITILFGVFTGLISIGLISLGVDSEAMSNLPSWLVILVYIVITGAYFIPFLLLYNFAIRIKAAILLESEKLFVNALNNLNQCLRFLGIITITIIAIYVLVRVGAGMSFVAGLI